MADDIKLVLSVDDRDLIRTQKEQAKFQKNLITIEQALRKGQITSARYNGELAKQAKQLSSLGGSYNKANSEVRKYAASLRKATDEKLKFGYAVAQSQKANRRFELGIQQAGYQVGDFATQVASGTNWVVALTQQGTQLVSFFGGPWGAAVGAAGAIIGAFAVYLMKSDEAAKETSDSLKDLESEIKSIDTTVKDWLNTKKAASMGITVEELFGLQSIEKAEEDVAKAVKALKDARKYAMQTGGGFGGVDPFLLFGFTEDSVKSAEKALADAQTRLANLRQKQHEDHLKAYSEILADREKELAITKAELTYKDDEFKKKMAIAAIERASYEVSLRKDKFSEQEISHLLDIYDQQVKINRELEFGKGWVAETKEILGELLMMDASPSFLAKAKEAMGDLKKLAEEAAAATRLAMIKEQAGVTTPPQQDTMRLPSIAGMGTVSPYAPQGSPRPAANPFKGDVVTTTNFNTRTGKGGGGGKSPAQQLEEYLQKIEQEVKLKRQQVGLSEQEARLAELRIKYEEAQIPVDEKRIESIAKAEEELRKATEAENKRTSMIQSFSNTIENALMAMVDGSQSVEDAFKGMLRNILLEIYRQQVAQPIATGIGDILGGLLYKANGGVFNKGVEMFANGGVVNSPTMFGHSAGVGVMGEAGPEAIMPLKRGPDGKLGVAGGGNVTVHQTFNFAANGDDSVKRIIAQAAPQIAQMTQKQIMDSRRRGGQMKATFS